MSVTRKHRVLAFVVAAVIVLGLAALLGIAGCGDAEETARPSSAGGSAGTAAEMTTTTWAAAEYSSDQSAGAPTDSSYWGADVALAGTLIALEAASGQKIISDAQLAIEVEKGKFQTVFDQAMALAGRYGGYLVSSNAYATDEEDSMKSGTVAIRVPSKSFPQALSDASKLGTLKNQSLSTQDVTEEYVDLQARITNAEANVNSLVALLDKAETVDEILYVRSVLNSAQEDLEALKGRMRFLDEHTSYSTIGMSIYEVGVEVLDEEESWGFVAAVKDGLRNVVKAFNAIIKGLGILVPILIVLAIVAYVAYLIVKAITRRSRERQQARYQPYPEGAWRYPAQPGAAQPGATQPLAPTGAASQPEVATQAEPVSPGAQPSASEPPEEERET